MLSLREQQFLFSANLLVALLHTTRKFDIRVSSPRSLALIMTMGSSCLSFNLNSRVSNLTWVLSAAGRLNPDLLSIQIVSLYHHPLFSIWLKMIYNSCSYMTNYILKLDLLVIVIRLKFLHFLFTNNIIK